MFHRPSQLIPMRLAALRVFILLAIVVTTLSSVGWAKPIHIPTAEEDAAYLENFNKILENVTPPPTLEQYATVEYYDQHYMGASLEDIIKRLTNDNDIGSALAWGLSYQMNSLNDMYRSTGNIKYLRAGLHCARVVFDHRDDRLGRRLFTGESAPVWSSPGYNKKGRSAFAVHTGVILYPILDTVLLTRGDKTLTEDAKTTCAEILKAARESLDYFNPNWINGPAEGEGYTIALGEEEGIEGKVQPVNRLSAMGKALWLSWKLTGNTTHRDRALAMAHFIKNRLTPITDGDFYLWNYILPVELKPAPMTRAEFVKQFGPGEDISHAEMTPAFIALMYEDGQVFDKTDMARLARTVSLGFGRMGDQGVLFDYVSGIVSPGSKPSLGILAITGRWLRLAPYGKDVYARIWEYQRRHVPVPSPLDLALLIRYKQYAKRSALPGRT